MICPYNHMNIAQVEQDTYEYDVEGRITMHQHTLTENRAFGTCKESDCALYRDNQCCYNLTQLDTWIGFEGLTGCEDNTEE